MTFIIITGIFTQFSQSNLNECLSKEDAIKKQYLERLKGCNSAPLEVLKENPYFRDFLEDFLNPRMVENKCL